MITENVQLALIGSIVPTLTVITGFIISWVSRKRGEAAAAASVQAIHLMVDGNLTSLKGELNVANEHIRGLTTAAAPVAPDDA